MDLSLSGRRAVVTGAGRGIGLAITAALAAEGAFVTAGSLGITDELQALVGRGNVNAIAVDLSTADGPARLVDTAVAGGPLDIVVNNVGAAPVRLEGFEAVTDEDWHTTWNLTFLAAVRTTRAALPALRAAGGGVVVSVCSVNSFLPDPSVIDYSAAKAALANFSKALSKEVGAHRIRVNTVSPGPVRTSLWLGAGGVAATVAAQQGGDPQAVVDAQASAAATGRFTEPDEVADVVLFLASNRARNITGADIVIDGGLVTTL